MVPPVGAALAYETVDYPGYAYPATHPARLQALGRLFGLSPVPACDSRVLELGCGDGANALAIAQTLPRARVTGLDAASAPIARGLALARDAGLENVELLVGDLADSEPLDGLGPFDYIIAHGVYSWISPALRGALLERCRRSLAADGIAFVSYNAYPGSYLRDMVRDILEYHLRGTSEPTQRLAGARELMETIASIEAPSPYARVLREHLQRMLAASDALLYHDDLAPVSTPFYFHEFIEHASAHGLQFLSEAELSESQMRDVPDRVARLMRTVGDDVVVREQYLDFFRNRMFRQTLLVHEAAPVQRAIDDGRLAQMHVSSPARFDGEQFVTPDGVSMTTSDPLVAAAMQELSDCWPASLSFEDLTGRCAARLAPDPLTPRHEDQLRGALLEVFVGRIVQLYGCALPVTARPTAHPVSSPLARAQCQTMLPVLSTLTGGNCALEHELQRRLLVLLDGTRNPNTLAGELEVTPEILDQALRGLAVQGLLIDQSAIGETVRAIAP